MERSLGAGSCGTLTCRLCRTGVPLGGGARPHLPDPSAAGPGVDNPRPRTGSGSGRAGLPGRCTVRASWEEREAGDCPVYPAQAGAPRGVEAGDCSICSAQAGTVQRVEAGESSFYPAQEGRAQGGEAETSPVSPTQTVPSGWQAGPPYGRFLSGNRGRRKTPRKGLTSKCGCGRGLSF